MARISDTNIIANGVSSNTELQEVFFGQNKSIPIQVNTIDSSGVKSSLDLTTATITASMIRRNLISFSQSGDRISLTLSDYDGQPIATATQTIASSDNIIINNPSNGELQLNTGESIQFWGNVFGGITAETPYYITKVGQNSYIQIATTQGGTPISLSDGTGTMSIVATTPTVIPVTVTVDSAVNGQIRMVLNQSLWGLVSQDDQLRIDAIKPVCYSGFVKIT